MGIIAIDHPNRQRAHGGFHARATTSRRTARDSFRTAELPDLARHEKAPLFLRVALVAGSATAMWGAIFAIAKAF